MTDSLDEDVIHIETPAQAEKHYLPQFISGKKDLTNIKEELRSIHGFNEGDVRITASVISNAAIKHEQNKLTPEKILYLFLGGIIVILGIVFFFYLFDRGFLAILPVAIAATGGGLIIKGSRLKRN